MASDLRGRTPGRFHVVDILGRGGMGEVYRARGESLGRDVAIKILPDEMTGDPSRVERFVQEARAASALNHPHLTERGRASPAIAQGVDLLSLLVANRPKAMSKSDLQERLWPDTFVVEKNLANLVSEIRDAIGDDPARPRFIRTVHRFGYAFQEEVRGSRVSAGRRSDVTVRLKWLAAASRSTTGST